ncbi:hypothetical protein [Microbacterium sp.]|uniref:hypothetical protein n=1 Tax=Microbacterium sp. TaxID=51671 RepID=UPI0035B2FCF0
MNEMERWWIEVAVNGTVGLVTLAALVVALIQVDHARREAIAARAAIARERRLSFELQLLAQMYDQWGTSGTAHLAGYINALIRDPLDETDLPLLRAATGTKPTERGQRLLAKVRRGSDDFKLEVIKELDAAIERRLKEESDDVRPRG